jgi:type IV pilus assembly protein PilB
VAETVLEVGELAARQLAARYNYEFVGLRDSHPDGELLRTIPLDLMLHYEFLPLEAYGHQLVIVVADPPNLARLDELEVKLDRQLAVRVAAPGQIRESLKKTEPSQRVLDEATEEFRLDVIHE